MCTVAEICSTGVRVTLSDVPEVLLTATNSEPQVQDAGLAAKAGTFSNGIGRKSDAVSLCSVRIASARGIMRIRRCMARRAPFSLST